jgi:alginate O-acetyltransferase complex protein AlgI
MVFSSSIFLFFFLPLVIAGYYLIKENYRIYFLLLASLFFYAWGEYRYVLIMILSITINYSFGMFIDKSHTNKNLAKLLLVLAVTGNLGILFYFKYLNFTLNTINRVFNTGFVYYNIVMPIGISFFTFQGMSYVIDLYWRKVDVQKNPAKLAFYISFFPQLIAGPIVRYIDIKEQIEKRTVSGEKFVSGAQRFVIGLAKKVIIANTLGEAVDFIFSFPVLETTAATAWLGIICYSFQIFFDFSGYSDMAIGLGRMFGFEFLENFNYPYISKSITEFWHRWHISLSSWFRDYVYIPLGGNRKGNVYVNLVIVFILTGFWHGAHFQFVVWGLWHGFFLLIERLFGMREAKKKKIAPLRYVMTMLIVIVGWVFFRAPGLQYAIGYLGVMFGLVQPDFAGLTVWFYFSPKIVITLFLAAAVSTPLFKAAYIIFKTHTGVIYKPIIYGLTLALLFICMVFVTASSYNPFIYFRF